MDARRLTAISLVAFVVATCADDPSSAQPITAEPPAPTPPARSAPAPTPATTAAPTPATTAAPTPATTAAPTPSPTSPPSPALPSDLSLVAVAERDGIRVRIELERNPMPAGEVTRVKTTVRNLGAHTLHWFSDGCSTPVHVAGEMRSEWRPGKTQDGTAKRFKDRALDLAYRSTPLPGPLIRFVPEDLVGQGYGCGDVGMYHDIAPGRAIHDERAWGGQADLRWGPPPTGPLTITGTFAWYWRGRPRNEPDYPDIPRIEVTLETWVSDGADSTWLSPPEIVDAALRDPGFLAYLETQRLGSGRAEILWFDAVAQVWEVGILAWYDGPQPTLHLVLVDPRTGEILDTVDRARNQETDGFP